MDTPNVKAIGIAYRQCVENLLPDIENASNAKELLVALQLTEKRLQSLIKATQSAITIQEVLENLARR